MNRIVLYFLSIACFSCFFCCSVTPQQAQSNILTDTIALKKHVSSLIVPNRYRNYLDTETLNKAADYIKNEFLKLSTRVSIQVFKVDGKDYRNILCSFGPAEGERIIVGAHYDVCGDQPGADDNASGVAGMLELARLLKEQPLKYRIDLVAYSLEEPPYFGTENMGSYVHAEYLLENAIPVKGMICLEMIGYFNSAPNSQQYPVGFLKWFYGSTGNYITVVQKFGNGSFGRQFNKCIRKVATIETKFLRSPKSLTGVDFSDHRNYWLFGYDAVMITNSSFYRNHNYHTVGDKMETLDFRRMALVVDEVYLSILKMNEEERL